MSKSDPIKATSAVEDWLLSRITLAKRQQKAQDAYQAWQVRQERWLAKAAPRAAQGTGDGTASDTAGEASRAAAEALFKRTQRRT